MQSRNLHVSLTLIRIVAALLIAIHGWHRLLEPDVAGLGEAIARHLPIGEPMGQFLGWVVTILEAFGAPIFAAGNLIASGRLIFPLGLMHMFTYVTSLCIYHLPHGWFTSGTDKDGCEYPVLLIAAFASVTFAHMPPRLLSLFNSKSTAVRGMVS